MAATYYALDNFLVLETNKDYSDYFKTMPTIMQKMIREFHRIKVEF
jgi:hypothetical protein